MERLRAYDNAIVPQLAAKVIGAFLDAEHPKPNGYAQAGGMVLNKHGSAGPAGIPYL